MGFDEVWSLRQCAVWIVFRNESLVAKAEGGWLGLGEFIRARQYDHNGILQFEIDDLVRRRLEDRPDQMLLKKLQSGKITAFAEFVKYADLQAVPQSYWQGVKSIFYVRQGLVDDKYLLRLGIPIAYMRAQWPATDDAAAGGPRTVVEISVEKQCEDFFRDLGCWSEDSTTAEEAKNLAAHRFPKLSRRAIDRAWRNGADITRRKPGRRSKH